MYRLMIPVVAAALVAGCGSDTSKLSTLEEKYSYALGQDIGGSLKKLPVEVKVEFLFKGVRDALTDDGKTLLPKEETAEVMKQFAEKLQTAQKEKQESATKDNTEKGQAFRDANAKKEGVTTTASGLQIRTIKKGDGAQPKASDTVTVHYVGTLIDGKEFDSSEKRGQPASFPLNGVIKGWTEGLQLMNVGGEYELVVPPELGYGANGAGQMIGPNATLIFNVKFLSIGEAKADGKK